MSVFVINSDNEAENESSPTQQKSHTLSEAGAALFQFWPRVTEEIRQIQNLDVRCQVLPLARIKKIMKLDDEVKMISGEAPVLFAKAAEMFIQELTLRAWIHTEDNKRRTLQRNDIAMAIAKYDQFDFLIDIVPREEMKPQPTTSTSRSVPLDHVQYYLQINQQQQQQQQAQSQPATSQVIAQPIQTVEEHKPMQLLQQVISPTGEIQHVPVQLSPSQMQMLRMQLQANTNQPLIIQPQIIQVTQSAAGNNPVFIQTTTTSQGEG